MLDRYQFDDVLEQERPLPVRGLNGSAADPVASQSGASILAQALAFDAEANALYESWSQNQLRRCIDKRRALVELADHEIAELLAGVQLAILSGDGEQGRVSEMDGWVQGLVSSEAIGVRALLACFSHQPQLTIDYYQSASQMDASSEEVGSLVRGLPAVVYVLSLVQQATQRITGNRVDGFDSAAAAQLESLVAKLGRLASGYQAQHRGDCFMPVIRVLHDFTRVLSGQREIGQTIWLGGSHIDANPWLDLFLNLARHWLGEAPDEQLVARLAAHVDQASENGLHWFVDEGLTLLSAQGLHRETREFQPQIRSTGWLLSVYQRQSDWRASLELLNLTVNRHARLATQQQAKIGNRRLSWWVDASGGRLRVEPREQRLGRGKQWDNGRRFPLKLLLDECGTLDFLCDDDMKICAHLRNQVQVNHALCFEKYFEITNAESLDLICHHPRIYRYDEIGADAAPVRVTVRDDAPSLQVVADSAQQEINISMQPFPVSDIKSASEFTCQWQDENVLSISRYTEGQLDIARALSYRGLNVPADAAESVLESLRSMAALLEVHSNLSDVDCNTVVAQTHLWFQLRPLEQGLDIACFVYPLGQYGPCVVPGCGKPRVHAVVNNRPCNAIRELDKELSQAHEVLRALPLPNGGVGWQWAIDNAEQALEVLAALQELDDKVSLLWPMGESISLSAVIDSDSMRVHFSSQQNGIDVTGELKTEADKHSDTGVGSYLYADEGQFDSTRVDLKKLLASLDSADGRFIRLDDGKVLQLSRRLREQLEALQAVSERGVAHELAVPMLAEATRGMVLQDDESWNEQLRKVREAEQLSPNPPKTLLAELRDYQLEGFRWMARLAHWGAGACLADDMGLGKTMQSLSLLLTRATGGPALVVAPTSVCGNWLAEAEKFAPSLRLRWMGDGNRMRILRNARAGDLIICSYGVLQNDIALFQEIQWHTVIADEAQSFKNAGTRRSQAMMSLQADFRMIATGTPIENHLGELWNLFRFINPGLLGSSVNFKERYASPIEQRDDDAARQRLKSLIKPFILRRLKREVLTELPERTEITHLVEFNEEENLFYQGLRKQALQRISELAGFDSEQRFRVLAEITTLRQACCHPALVDDQTSCSSAKLRAFAQVVDELRRNGHRCLVFSQFVGHLALIRHYLDANNISYQYLDGSTSVRNRKAAVDDFQAGEGELFLISLKAGGSGLNLTAADYVIHMDPWWNPAVEDQASDRAYRMGQKRPVTIYRMVVKDTIEEKIVNLHEQKRDLANALLEGTDSGSRLSVEQLVELIDDESAEALAAET